MFDPAAHPDGWHNVTAPGGYEWWYFDAESADRRYHIVAIFLQGFVFHPGYVRKYEAFRRRPSKVRPPVAGDFPCAYFVVYEHGKIRKQLMTQLAPADFRADRDRPSVAIGPNTMSFDGDYRLHLEGVPWELTMRGPQFLTRETLSSDLTFKPVLAGLDERTFFDRSWSGADHRWILAAPRCEVDGQIDLGDGETVAFQGAGYHDHNFGTGPIGPGLDRWLWGRVLTSSGVTAFHYARPADASLPAETHLLEVDRNGPRESDPPVTLEGARHSSWRLAFPQSAHFGQSLSLSNPRVVDSAPFYMRLIYDATLHGESAQAFCEIAYPHRLRWPVLGRMVEMSIDKTAVKQTS